MKRLSGKLTYANVISTLCLFLVLGGGAAFAASGGLEKNSVGPKQLKKGAVTTAKIKDGAVNGAKINLPSLGVVPQAKTALSATTAGTANSAGTAKTAETATSAANANALGGVPANGYERRTMWALVNGDGTIVEQTGGISLQGQTGGGGYFLHFPEQVAGKAITVTPWESWEPADPGVEASACGFPALPSSVSCAQGTNTTSDVFVGTQESGVFKKMAFYVVVIP